MTVKLPLDLSGSALTLYGYWRSSATWRARTGLELRAVPYTYVPVHLVRDGGEQNSAEFLRRNPLGQVPVLEWTVAGVPHRLTQSLAILEWIDDVATTGSALRPADPFARARARQLAEMVNAGIQPFQNLWLTKTINEAGADGRSIGATAIGKGLDAIEAELGADLPAVARPGRWMVGDAPSIADICLIPQLYNARRFGFSMDRWPRLAAIEAVAAEHPAFQRAHPDQQPDAVTA